MPEPSDRTAARAARYELGALVRLALPLVAAQLGSQMMGFVDTAMVGRLGATALAGAGIGDNIYFALSLLGYGCVMGADPVIAQALGAGEETRAWRAFQAAVRVAVTAAVPLMLLLALAPPLVAAAGVDAATTAEVRHYLLGRFPGTVPFLLFAAERSYLQARARTRPIVIAIVAANVVNFLGNALLIYGDDALRRAGLPGIGLPPLGVLGAGLASSLSLFLMVGILARAIRAEVRGATFHRPEAIAADAALRSARALAAQIVRVGGPIGLQLFAEVAAFALAGLLAGRMSPIAGAGHQVALRLASCTFTVAVGVGASVAVRVGFHVGRGDALAARRSGTLGLGVAAGFMSCGALTFLLAPGALARVLTDDPRVVAAALPLVMISAVFQLSDGTQAVAAGALRGAGDTRASFYANLVGHYAIGLPVAVALGFAVHLGAPGLWWGLSAGLTAVAVGLTLRFFHITRRAIARV